MTRPDRLIQITVVFLAVGAALAGNANGQTRSTDRFLRVPSSAYPTIQSAIDAAPNGMKIVVAPGTYSETLLVQGKIVHIRGSEDPSQTTIAGDRPRGIVPANAAVGLVNYKNGGGGTLYGFRLVGGDAGITGRGLRGDRAAGREALRLDIRNVEISGSGRGILWDSPAAIVVSNSKISDTWGNGVSLLQGLLKSSYLTIVDAGQVGIYVANADATFDNVVSGFNASAGFYIYKSHVFITDSSVFDNVVAGVWAVHSDLTAYGTSSYANKANDVHRFGDGWVMLLSNANLDVSAKTLELLTTAAPKISQVAILGNPGSLNESAMLKSIQAAARNVGVAVMTVEATTPGEIEIAFAAMVQQRANAVVIAGDAFLTMQASQIAGLAIKYRLPSITQSPRYAAAGGLMSYGQNPTEGYRRAAAYVDKILKGADPGSLPIEQPTRLEFVINMKTADTLGLTIPAALLLRADAIIR